MDDTERMPNIYLIRGLKDLERIGRTIYEDIMNETSFQLKTWIFIFWKNLCSVLSRRNKKDIYIYVHHRDATKHQGT